MSHNFTKQYIGMHLIYTTLFLILNIANGFLVNSTIFNEYLSTYNRDLFMIINYMFGDFGFMTILFAFGILFFKKDISRMRYMMIVTLVVSMLCIMSSMYIYNYGTVFAFSNLTALNNPAGGMALEFMLSMATVLFRHAQYLTLIPVIVMVSLYIIYRKKFKSELEGTPVLGYLRSRLYMGFSFIFIGILLMVNALASYQSDIEETWFEENGSVLYGIQTIGMFNYYVYDFYATYLSDITDVKEEKIQALKDYLNDATNPNQESPLNGVLYGNNTDTAHLFEGKNLILIQVESLSNFVIGLEINGVEVTPNLNMMALSGSYFNKFYSTVGIGNTSDAEFSVMTGLYPDGNRVSIYEYERSQYDTLAKAFSQAGYHTFSIHGNVSTFYSRGTNHLAMFGFDTHIGMENLENKTGLVHQWINDYDLLMATLADMEATTEVDFAYPITISCHTPYLEDPVVKAKCEEFGFSASQIKDPMLKGYLEHMFYTDWAIGEFLKALQEAALPEETVVALYGDHGAGIDPSALAEAYSILENEINPILPLIGETEDENHIFYARELSREVPFIIYEATTNPLITPSIYSKVRCSIDIFRTLANLYDLIPTHYFGNDCFSDAPGIAYNPRNMDCFTDEGMIILPSEQVYGNEISQERLQELIEIIKELKGMNDKVLRWGDIS